MRIKGHVSRRRAPVNGSLKARVNKMQKGRDFTFILKDISLNGSAGYLIGDISGKYNLSNNKWNTKINLGQDVGFGYGVGFSGKAFLVIPLKE